MSGPTISRRRLSAKIVAQLDGLGKGAVAAAAARANTMREPGVKAVVDTSAFSRAVRQPVGLDHIYRAIARSYGYEPVTQGDAHTLFRRIRADVA